MSTSPPPAGITRTSLWSPLAAHTTTLESVQVGVPPLS